MTLYAFLTSTEHDGRYSVKAPVSKTTEFSFFGWMYRSQLFSQQQ